MYEGKAGKVSQVKGVNRSNGDCWFLAAENSSSQYSLRKILSLGLSVFKQAVDRRHDVVRLRQDRIFELRLVRTKGVPRSHALHRRIKFFE